MANDEIVNVRTWSTMSTRRLPFHNCIQNEKYH